MELFSINDFPSGPPDKIILMLSGGLDSAILMYLICKQFPSIKVIPYSGADKSNPADIFCAKDIVQFMRVHFPNANIENHEEYQFDSNNNFWLQKAKEEFDNFNFATVNGLSSHFQQVNALKDLKSKTGVSTFVNGVTANPPKDEMIENEFLVGSDHYRNVSNIPKISITRFGSTMYKPWINIDKKSIAAIYKKEGLMDTLYPLTKSCTNPASTYENRECGICWWCKEKEWGFNK